MKKTVNTLTLIDSGTRGKFINQNYVKKLGLIPQKPEEPLLAQNVDGTPDKSPLLSMWISLLKEEQNCYDFK